MKGMIRPFEYVGLLVDGWQVVDWTSLTAFYDSVYQQRMEVGMHLIDALNLAGALGWEMTAAIPETEKGKSFVRYWFKRHLS